MACVYPMNCCALSAAIFALPEGSCSAGQMKTLSMCLARRVSGWCLSGGIKLELGSPKNQHRPAAARGRPQEEGERYVSLARFIWRSGGFIEACKKGMFEGEGRGPCSLR